jgi:Protein of unknown function (DUF2855)
MITRLKVKRHAFETAEIATAPLPELAEGQVLARVERFALTANNITYAATGDKIGYWQFFPEDDAEWGMVPVWGFAVVESSCHPDVPVGTRVYGYLPMASHVVMAPTRVSSRGFTDGGPHRAALPAVYNHYQSTSDDSAKWAAAADWRCLLIPLMITGYVIGDYVNDNGCFGATQIVIGSASSKTGIATAHHARSLAEAPVTLIGLTSPGNIAFCEGLGVYDRVVAYADVETLDAAVPMLFIDMAGDGGLTTRLHHHFGANMKASIGVGLTHWQSRVGQAGRPPRDLPGAKPIFFFAPAQIAKRRAEWGPGVLDQRMLEANLAFLPVMAQHLKIERGEGAEAVAAAYAEMVAGRTAADVGVVLSFG